MITVGHIMSELTKGRVKITDPVSAIIYKQFQQVTVLIIYYAVHVLLHSCVIKLNST